MDVVIPDSDGLSELQSPSRLAVSVADHIFSQDHPRLDKSSSPPAPEPNAPVQEAGLPTPPKRSLRERAPQQLHPYTLEQVKYAFTLSKRDWQDAVVIQKHKAEPDAQDLLAKKQAALRRGADDLDGWLELEAGMQVRQQPEDSPSHSSRPLSKVKKRKQSHRAERDRALRKALTGISDSDAATPSSSSDREIVTNQHKRKRHSSEGLSIRNLPIDLDTASSSPDPVASTSKLVSRKKKLPSGKSEPRSKSTGLNAQRSSSSSSSSRESEIDSDIEIVGDKARPKGKKRLRRDSSSSPPPAQFALTSKKKKQLRGMMPGVFFKKAEADLKLMAREKLEGRRLPELYKHGSGDEQSDEFGSEFDYDEKDPQHAAVVKKKLIDEDVPFRLQGDTESDDNRRSSDSDSSPLDADHDLSSWLHANAPRRNPASKPAAALRKQSITQTEDLIERMLSRASRNATGLPRGKRKKRRKPLKERRNREEQEVLVAGSAHAVTMDRIQQTAKYPSGGRSLADDDILFPSNRIDDLDNTDQQPHLRKDRAWLYPHVTRRVQEDIPPVSLPEQATSHARNGAKKSSMWSAFNKFSYDFDMQPLQPRTKVSPASDLASGRYFSFLQSLRQPNANRPSQVTIFPFGIQLDYNLKSDELIDLLPRLCDNVTDSAIRLASTENLKLDAWLTESRDTLDVIRFLGISCQNATHLEADALMVAIQSQLNHLERRLSTITPIAACSRVYEQWQLVVNWSFFELGVYLHQMAHIYNLETETLRPIESFIRSLIKLLLDHGVNRSGKMLKEYQNDPSIVICDASILVWAQLINFAIYEEHATFPVHLLNQEEFWLLLDSEMSRRSETLGTHPVVAAEANAYLVIMCCCISQISSTGIVLLESRIPHRWPIIAQSLQPISIDEIQQDSTSLTNSEITRRDGYIWTLASRCLVLTHRWRWRLDCREDLIPKLYDIVNARSLKNSPVEGRSDFPSFLVDYRIPTDTTLHAKEDSTFHIFLKLLLKLLQDQSDLPEPERDRNLTRLLMRVSPVKRKLPYTRDAGILDPDRSMLINHYSLFLTSVILLPKSMSRRLSQMQALLSYVEADDASRPIILRSMLYLGVIYQKHNIPIGPIVDWFASICQHLRAQYIDVERKRAMSNAPKQTVMRGMSAITNIAEKEKTDRDLAASLFKIAVALSMILRAWQNIMIRGGSKDAYPDVACLNAAWSSYILESPIAQDPLVGMECIKLIHCFFRLRKEALQSLRIVNASQDEFGFEDFDVNDAALNDLIGYQAPVANASPDSLRLKDAEFAKFVRTQLSPSLWKALSAIYAPDLATARSAPVISEASQLRGEYVLQMVECWTSCASVLVSHNLKDWNSYLVFGEENYKRIADPLGRREVGLLFGCCLAEKEPEAFERHQDEFFSIWLETLIARRLTHQEKLTNSLLNSLAYEHALLQNIAQGKSLTTGQYAFTLDSLIEDRLGVLTGVMRNAHLVMSGNCDSAHIPTRDAVLQFFNNMLGAMRDNLESFESGDVVAKQEYESFCRAVLSELKDQAGQYITERSVGNLRLLGGIANA